IDLLELWPQHPVDKGLRRFEYQRLPLHPRVPKRPQPITTTQRHEQTTRPGIQYAELHLDGLFSRLNLLELCSDSFGRCASCYLLADNRRAGEQRLDLPQFLPELGFAGHPAPRFARSPPHHIMTDSRLASTSSGHAMVIALVPIYCGPILPLLFAAAAI